MKKNVWLMFSLSLVLIICMSGLATAFVYNQTRNVNNFTTDINWASGTNVTLINNNASVQMNSSGIGTYLSVNQTLLINATTINITWSSNDSSSVEVNYTITGGANYKGNVTSGTGLNWPNSQPGHWQSNNLIVRVRLMNNRVAFHGVNFTFGINMTSSAIGSLNIPHLNVSASAYWAYHNVTPTSNAAMTYSLNNTGGGIFSINTTGAISGANNVANSGWYSFLACANALETTNCQSFTLNLSNTPFHGLAVSLNPSADPPQQNPVTATITGTDDENDQIIDSYCNWYLDNVLQTTTITTFSPGGLATHILLCEGIISDGKTNSTVRANGTSVRIAEGLTGGGGGGGSGGFIPVTPDNTLGPRPPTSTPSATPAAGQSYNGPNTSTASHGWAMIMNGQISDGFTEILNALLDAVGVTHT